MDFRNVKQIFAAALLVASAGVASAQNEKVLSLNNVSGIQETLERTPTRKLTVVQGAGNTTDGDGALRMQGVSTQRDGNRYFGIVVPLGRTWDFTKTRLAIDARSSEPENTGAFYVRAYNKGEKQPALSFTSWDHRLKSEWSTFHFQHGGRGSELAWEAPVVGDRVPNQIDRIEFIVGTNHKGTPVDLQIDNLRTMPPVLGIADLTSAKPLHRTVAIASETQARATILHPDTDAGRAAAQSIAAAVRQKTGASLTARAATKADHELQGNAILLGNATNNPALFLLYTRRFVPVDFICPGPSGTLLQTVHDPFGNGHSAVVVGASDDAGLKSAAAALVAKIEKSPAKTVSFAKFFEAKYSPEFLKRFGWAGRTVKAARYEEGLEAARNVLETGKHTSIAGELRTAAQRYQLTGSSVEARLFAALWELYDKSAVTDASKFGGAWGFDSDFPSYEVVAGWDNIEEDPALTDEQRLAVTKSMARWLTEAVVPKASMREGRVPFNHQTFPALGVLRAGLYFTQAYPSVMEGRQWLGQADRLFKNQANFYKPYEDCNTYQWLTNGHMMTYAVARPDFTVFENGNAERISDYAIATMNNLGYQVPYGDTGVWSGSSAENNPLSTIAFMTGNPAAQWVANLKIDLRGGVNMHGFQRGWSTPAPDKFNGVKSWALDPGYLNTFPVEKRPADNQLFDKVSFRGALDKEAPYLLLDGLNNGGHGHYDGNSIEQLTQYDRIWLVDNDYFKTHVKYHNSMQILRNGQASSLPPYAALLGHGETENYGYSHTRLGGYSGADWDRYVIQLKNSDAFLVLDKVTAEEDGEYQFRLLWHGVGDATMTEDGMLLKQKGPSMWFQVAKGPQLNLINDEELGKNWSSYPHAEAVVRSMNATSRVRLQKGQHYLFASVFHGSKSGEVAPWKLDFTQGYNGVSVQTGREALEVRLENDRLQLQSTPGVTTFQEPQSNVVSRSAFQAGAAGVKTALGLPPANLTQEYNAPAFRSAWSVKPAPQELLLTGNSGQSGALKKPAALTIVPEPKQGGNVLDATSANHAGALLDGQVDRTGQAVMFPADQKVTITIDLHQPAQLSKIEWRQWWAKTSSRQTAYLLDNGGVELSNDAFKNDVRPLGAVQGGEHADWGTPITFEVDGKGQTARYVRLTLTPRPGSSIYLAEIGVRGKTENADVADVASSYTSLNAARLQKDGPEIILATTAEGLLQAISSDGRVVWSKGFSTPLNDVAAGDVDGDGVDEIAIARQDGHTTLFDATGRELWSKQLQYYRRPPYVNLVRMGDLDGDGKAEVVSGGENWRFYAYDGATGKELWQFETVHPSRSGAIVDLDGDGKKEVVAGTHYYTASVLSHDGKRLWSYRLGPISYDIAAGNFDGNKTRGVVIGAGDGVLHYTDSKGEARLKFDTGDEVRQVATDDLDGDGKDEILAASGNAYLYCFGADGKLRWLRYLGTPATSLETTRIGADTVVMAGTRAGELLAFGAKGELVRRSELNSAVTRLLEVGGATYAATEDGRLMRLNP